MKIHIEYQPTVEELANASRLFVEKKPFMVLMISLINMISGLLLVLVTLKLIGWGLQPPEWLAFSGAAAWLFGRRPFNKWLLRQRMRRSPAVNKRIYVDISRNGIVWSGEGLKPGNLGWEALRYLFEVKNGFILPTNFAQFLWLPQRGFNSTEAFDHFKELLQEKAVNLRRYPKWHC